MAFALAMSPGYYGVGGICTSLTSAFWCDMDLDTGSMISEFFRSKHEPLPSFLPFCVKYLETKDINVGHKLLQYNIFVT